MAAAVFFYDLGDPECYLAAERITGMLPGVAEWEPVHAVAVGAASDAGRDATAVAERSTVAERAAEFGLQPLRWPARWPPDTRTAALAATFAKRSGRAVAFSLAAFRQAFAGGRDLSELDTVLIAAAACELHPTAVLKGISLRSIASELERACARASAAGVERLPAIAVAGTLVSGPSAVERAASVLADAA